MGTSAQRLERVFATNAELAQRGLPTHEFCSRREIVAKLDQRLG